MTVLEMSGLDLAGKRVLIRQDLNVPVRDGAVTSDLRIKASLPTIRHCINAGAQLMIMSHLGRPEEGVAEWIESACEYFIRHRGSASVDHKYKGEDK